MGMQQRTKIVCTMGPSTEDEGILRQMILAGMTVARYNFSHGDHEYHRQGIERVRRVADELDKQVALMADTKGPEIRTGLNKDHKPFEVRAGDTVVVTTEEVEGTSERFCLDYQSLPSQVEPGSHIFVDDGLIDLEVMGVDGRDITCRVINGGAMGERKGVNIPNIVLDLPALTERDKDDIRFACDMGMDAIAISFVCDAASVNAVRELCDSCGRDDIMLISKIESALAVNNFISILAVSDGIMVARGDLGIEIPPAEVPHVQKKIIAACNKAYKPVITATQMLESMTHNPRPTRAEVTDVANAIFDGTDCVMLSGETAAGNFPTEAVRMMAEVCQQAERHLRERRKYHEQTSISAVSSATGFAAVELARRVGAVAILCPTVSGRTARIMSSFRPALPILVTTPLESTMRHTNFYWGVQGMLTEEQEGLSRTFFDSLQTARKLGYVQQDDIVVLTAGDPLTSPFTKGIETATNVCAVAQAM